VNSSPIVSGVNKGHREVTIYTEHNPRLCSFINCCEDGSLAVLIELMVPPEERVLRDSDTSIARARSSIATTDACGVLVDVQISEAFTHISFGAGPLDVSAVPAVCPGLASRGSAGDGVAFGINTCAACSALGRADFGGGLCD
jgi:hypothetical protein